MSPLPIFWDMRHGPRVTPTPPLDGGGGNAGRTALEQNSAEESSFTLLTSRYASGCHAHIRCRLRHTGP